jgi:hypothetical protein
MAKLAALSERPDPTDKAKSRTRIVSHFEDLNL